MTQLSHEEYQATKWRGKPRSLWGNNHDRPRDEENVPPNLDYKAIEQIADGVEKMILAWSNGEEREPYLPTCMPRQGVESCTSSPAVGARGLQKQGQTSSPAIKSPLSEKSFAEDGGCNYMCPVQIQEGPAGSTTEISITGKCPAAGMGSSISQIVRAESITNKDTHAEKSVTKTATYWYMESSNGNTPACRVNSRQAEEKPESTGRTGGFRSTFNQTCYNDHGLGVRHWSKEETDVRSVLRSETDERLLTLGNEAGESTNVAPLAPTIETQLKSSNRRGSRHSRKRETVSSKHHAKGDQQPIVSHKFAKLKQEGEDQSQVLQTKIKLKEGALEVPPLPRVKIGNFDALLDSIVIDDELLEKKLAALTTMPPTPLLNPVELSEDERQKQVQDLQIALLECAMEYELKTIELKMKIKSLQSTPKQSDPESKSISEKTAEQQLLYSKSSRESQIVESMKKQIFKLQREKAALTKEFLLLQKKERKFETQQRSLDDALLRVNRLTKEVVKKEHELLEAQLIEKQTRVQLQEKEDALAKAEAHQMPVHASGIEPAKLVAALPSLREWIRTLKRDHTYEPMIVKMVDGYYSPGEDPDNSDALKSKSTNEMAADNAQKVVEKMVHTLMKEVQALQRELGRLGGCRSLRPKSAPLSGEFLKPTHLKKEHSKK